MATEWLLTPNRWKQSHKLTIDTDSIHEQLSVITDLLVIFHLQDTIARISNQLTIACSVYTGKAYLISERHILPRAISYYSM